MLHAVVGFAVRSGTVWNATRSNEKSIPDTAYRIARLYVSHLISGKPCPVGSGAIARFKNPNLPADQPNLALRLIGK